MLFNRQTLEIDDDKVLSEFPKWVRKSEHYDDLKSAKDLSVHRQPLSEDEKIAANEAGDLLYSFLKKGYTCLGNFSGKPKPNMARHGILTVLRHKGMGFYIETDL